MKEKLPELMKRNAVIIDVRSPSEFSGGANSKSRNIPLDQLNEGSLHDISKDRPIILCCASGMRSQMAVLVVKKMGFSEVYNGGPWMNTVCLE